ncbi:tyrosine-protein phosphatase [Streptomyces sp. NPDC005322]|uniref:tyrosine-protein phosphatase n=1 Tax=unclassified Streptomyces TaxID=2593676 RepID=UPI0033BE4B21
MGGYPTGDGRTMRWARLFRSDSLGGHRDGVISRRPVSGDRPRRRQGAAPRP